MSTIAEASEIYTKLISFFKDQFTYITSGGIKPSESTLVNLPYPNLLTYASEGVNGPAGFEVGVAQDAIFFSAAINREISMSELTKSEIFGNYASECQGEATFYSIFETYTGNVLSGGPSNGSKS